MKIYTKTGDKGETSLYRGGRVPKDAPRLEAYGTLDELNSTLGLALALLPASTDGWHDELVAELRRVQKELFGLGAQLATVGGEAPAWRVVESDVVALEAAIDMMETALTPLKTFVLPGGHPTGASLHIARTITRRAERLVVAVQRTEDIEPVIGRYLNRLSDYLFVAARYVNHRLASPERPLVM